MPAEAAWGAEYSADFAFRCAVTSSSQELAMTDARFLRIRKAPATKLEVTNAAR